MGYRIACALALTLTLLPLDAADYKTKTIILVTADGLRPEEVFKGVDSSIPSKHALQIKGTKREELLPFLWSEVAARGVIMRARVTNPHRVSYPGYSEILTGRAQDAIRGNDPVQNPTPTVLEYLREHLKLRREQVALFGSWDSFRFIGEHTPGAIVINAGYQTIDGTPRLAELSRMQSELLTAWPEVRHDYFTFEMALAYLRSRQPRVLYIAFGETDDWAHEQRYDRYLQTAAYFDACLRKLWETVDRSSTTLVITTDHGRGATPADWHSHGKDVAGAENMWIAIIGPDTPALGEAKFVGEQRDVAPTMLELMGADPAQYRGVTGKVLREAIAKVR